MEFLCITYWTEVDGRWSNSSRWKSFLFMESSQIQFLGSSFKDIQGAGLGNILALEWQSRLVSNAHGDADVQKCAQLLPRGRGGLLKPPRGKGAFVPLHQYSCCHPSWLTCTCTSCMAGAGSREARKADWDQEGGDVISAIVAFSTALLLASVHPFAHPNSIPIHPFHSPHSSAPLQYQQWGSFPVH